MLTTESYSFRDILRVFFSHKAYFIVLPIILTVSAYIGGELKTPVYEASVKMFIKAQKKTEAEFYTGIHGQDIISDHSELVLSNAVLSRVVEALKLYERPNGYEKKYATTLKKAFIDFTQGETIALPNRREGTIAAMQRLSSSISVTPIRGSSLFYITVTDFDPRAAVRIANSISRSYVIFDLEQQIEEIKLKYGEKHSTVLQLEDYIEDFKKTLHGGLIPDIEALGPASIKIVAQAEGADMRSGTSKYTLMIFSFFTGIMLAISFAVITEYLSNTINTPRNIVEYFNLSFLGSLPKRHTKEKRLISEINPKITKYTKSIQNLSEHLSLVMRDKAIKTLLFTDVEGTEETTIVCANLAMFLAKETGRRVLVMDADLRASSLSKLLGVSDTTGLAGMLEGTDSIMDTVQELGSNLYVIPSGKTDINPTMLLDTSNISEIIDKAGEVYDVIFINCPRLKDFNDSYLFSFIADGTVMIVNEGKVKRQIFDSAIAPLRQEKVNILGVILTNRKYVIPELIYNVT